MVFTELRFLWFFLAVFGVYWSLRGNAARKWFLLGASYAFYCAWDWRFSALILLQTATDFTAARRIERDPAGERRRAWLLVSIVANLSVLAFFKYCGFFAESGAIFLAWLGLPVSAPALAIVLPLGISFYTFETMSYTIDVYRGKTRARGLLDLSVFVAFFPHLVAGPILRASDFLPQLESARRWADVPVRAALASFLLGYLKKACIADNLAPIVDVYFADPGAYDAAAAWLAVLLYAVQIYCDFSGYSNMAIGAARLLGYELCVNFDTPYFAASVTEFWRRWHMSLSSWLRDYLYIPLGGSRSGSLLTYRNLLLTMLLGGLWHGAAWTFVAWGGLHGLALAAERALGVQVGAARGWRRALGTLLTFWFVCVAWIFFRAKSFAAAAVTLRSFALFHSPGRESLPPFLFAVFAALAGLALAARCWPQLGAAWQRLPPWGFALAYGGACAVAIAWFPFEYRPFIYFQF